jgi:subtilisin family serine protease
MMLNAMPPAPAAAVGQTPDFTGRQDYLGPAPVGIDAFFAWGMPGGRGTGVRVIDCEWGWNFDHEDLLLQQGGVLVGKPNPDDNHGTAVIGEIIGNQNKFGVTGIVPEAMLGVASFDNKPSAETIREAADKLWPGDILLLEIHRAGPSANGQGQFGYIGIEWWLDDYVAIRYAVAKGIVVVEAAGNGQQDLDAAIYDQRPPDFPASWRNPFNPANPSSGAILVGAGNPPAGTHGRTQEPSWKETYVDRARCVFSNFGRRVDCQGWGWEVTSTGYGDLQGGADRDRWYTDQFSGTSSASPIVTGAVAALQGVLKARGRPLLTSPQAIALLRATGSPQQAAPGRPVTERIGNRPNLRQLIPGAMGPGV